MIDNLKKIDIIGKERVLIFVPSLYHSGAPIPKAEQDKALNCVTSGLQEIFYGATTPEVTDATGTYQHKDGRVVDEKVKIVAALTDEKCLTVENYGKAVQIAADMGKALDQESILLCWGEESHLIYPNNGTHARDGLNTFNADEQRHFIILAWHRILRPKNLLGVLSLAGWTPAPANASDKRLLASHGKRQAFIVDENFSETDFASNSILFCQKDQSILIWAKDKKGLHGPRTLYFAHGGKIPTVSIEVMFSLLECKDATPFIELLDQSLLTDSFYSAYRSIHHKLVAYLKNKGTSEDIARQETQRLLSRLMFLRFIEQKGWLDNKRFLLDTYKNKKGNYYQTELLPLFIDVFNTPKSKRKSPLPFFNGGLFSESSLTSTISIPDDFFDPKKDGSIFNIFSQYEFTLDDFTTVDKAVAVNPAMFGRVLESLYGWQKRKKEGVYYTPPEIAYTLAFEGITSRLSDLTGINLDAIKSFLRGADTEAISNAKVKEMRDVVHKLKILDPAVGSGSLLLASLEVLMSVVARCGDKLGEQIIKGGVSWGDHCRQFITQSLYGVDISQDPVEITRLRLWLALAVGAGEPSPLPEIGHNIHVGDSLSPLFDPALPKDFFDRSKLELHFDNRAAAANAWRQAIGNYLTARAAADYNMPDEYKKVTALKNAADNAERKLWGEIYRSLGRPDAGAVESGSAPIPFSWLGHFPEVFSNEPKANNGFDLVIANPPYVRAHNLGEKDYSGFESMNKGAKDLYFAFIEQAIKLAGKEGRISFIMPDFSQIQAAAALRKMLSDAGAITLFLTFRGLQVFQEASNYTALLFASNRGNRRKEFKFAVAKDKRWENTGLSIDWISSGCDFGKCAYNGKAPWALITGNAAKNLTIMQNNSKPLNEFCKIGVGVQTSADNILLFSETVFSGAKAKVWSTIDNDWVELESGVMKLCAKGSKDLKAFKLERTRSVLWLYNASAKLIPESTLIDKYPMAWAYLKRHEKALRNRGKGKFNKDGWWCLGKEQGIADAYLPKVLIPSLLKGPGATIDLDGKLSYTASGKGGGGAWGITPKTKEIELLWWILAVLNSSAVWINYIEPLGDSKRGGWRGIDKTFLSALPIPKADMRAKALCIQASTGDESAARELDKLVFTAFGL